MRPHNSLSSPRSESRRRRTGTAIGTSCERSAAPYRRRYGPTPPSSRNAYHQKSRRSNPDRRGSVRIRRKAQTRSKSIPNRCPEVHQLRMRFDRRENLRRAQDPSCENRNFRALPWDTHPPTDTLVPAPPAPLLLPCATGLRSADSSLSSVRRRSPRHGSHTRANLPAAEPDRTSCDKTNRRRRASKTPDEKFQLLLSTSNQDPAIASAPDNRQPGRIRDSLGS